MRCIKKALSLTIAVGLIMIGTLSTVEAGWQKIASISSPRQEFPGALLNGKIYIAGGMNSNSCCNQLDIVEEYDIAGNSWRLRKNMPYKANHPGIVALNGKIYVMGGFAGSNKPTNQMHEYNPSSNSWTAKASMPHTAAAPGCCVYDGKIWVFGGTSEGSWRGAGNQKVQVWDPSNNKWTVVNSNMPKKQHLGVGIVGKYAYISPGRMPRDDDRCERFEFAKAGDGSAAWKTMASMPGTGRTGYMAGWPVVGGKLYYIGGEASSCYKEIHVFDPSDGDKGSWERIGDYPTKIHGIGPVAVGNTIYVMGGGTNTNVTDRTANCYKLVISGVDATDAPYKIAQRPHCSSNSVRLIMNRSARDNGTVYSLTGRPVNRSEATGMSGIYLLKPNAAQ